MIAWWRSIGWAILAAGVGIAVLGLTGERGWLEEVDRSARSGIGRASLAQEFGLGWQWQEHQVEEKVWLWQGFQRVEQTQAAVRVIEMNGGQSAEFSNELMGPVSLAVLLQAMNEEFPAVAVRYWPTTWLRSQEVSISPLQESLQGQKRKVIAACALDWVNEPLPIQQSILQLMRPLPMALPEQMDLLEVNSAILGWPRQEALAEVLWAGVPTAVLANYEREGYVMRVPLLVRSGQELLPTLPLLTALDVLGVRGSQLQLSQQGEQQFLLTLGEQGGIRLDEQGRLAVPVSAFDERGDLLPRMSMADFLPLLHRVELPEFEEDELTQGDQLAGARVLWFDEQDHQMGLCEAQALAQILQPSSQVQERELRVNRPLGAVSLLCLALVMARMKRRSHRLELSLALVALVCLVFVSYLAMSLGHWWVSPLPGLLVLALMLFFRERQRWVQAARENLLAEQQAEGALEKASFEKKPDDE